MEHLSVFKFLRLMLKIVSWFRPTPPPLIIASVEVIPPEEWAFFWLPFTSLIKFLVFSPYVLQITENTIEDHRDLCSISESFKDESVPQKLTENFWRTEKDCTTSAAAQNRSEVHVCSTDMYTDRITEITIQTRSKIWNMFFRFWFKCIR